jgi:hypothetical protein
VPGWMYHLDDIYRSVLDGSQPHAEISGMRRCRFMTGEALRFGIVKGCAVADLKERGFRLAQDIDAAGLKQAYFNGKNASRKVTEGYGMVMGVA